MAVLTITASCAWSQVSPDAVALAALDQWKKAVIAGDAAVLTKLYSTEPAAQVEANSIEGDASKDTTFWLGMKARDLKLQIVRIQTRPRGLNIIFNAEVETADGQKMTVADSQVWLKQGNDWRLRYVTRTDAPHLKQPSDMKKDLYPAEIDARAEIKAAEEKAGKDHTRLLLVFGANWCYDCHVLDLAFHRSDFAPVMARYEVVHIDIGDDGKKNNDLAAQFDVPLNKGVPAVAVVDSNGKLVVSQKNGEFENARAMTPEVMLEFLNNWK